MATAPRRSRGDTVWAVFPGTFAAQTPDKAAVILADGRRITYAELDAEANRLLVLLASAGIEATLQADSFDSQAVWLRGGDADAARRLLADESRHGDAAEAIARESESHVKPEPRHQIASPAREPPRWQGSPSPP